MERHGVAPNVHPSLADKLNHVYAIALIEAAGLVVGRVGVHFKPVQASRTTTPGMVALVLNRLLLAGRTKKKVTFHWQYSVDAVSWLDGGSGHYTETTLSGLTSGTTYYFRVRATVGKTEGAWTEWVDLLVP